MKNVFNKKDKDELISRINQLTAKTQPQWGKMNVGQMLAHCCVPYEMTFENIHKKPGAFKKFLLKMLVKQGVVGMKPYPKNSRTAPQFLMTGEKDFNKEKTRLIDYLTKTQELGEEHFDNLDNHSFGPLTKSEWNIMFYKHLDHHLTQFGV